ncbi:MULTISPECIES: universal stress protein [Hyphomicrobiales]|uniref:Universal stress protein n=1 Tax=Agrobacterium pusense TaxID=648995 RepID=A0AA44EPP4_9HYPH|nr:MULTISPECIES: universal stress protein [Hyphomicrobiales]KAB2737372.1 universal stress protein [Brucella anthropi]NRF11368.1 universal stress protein [Agrobacterium pusense]NRF22078.1 universal stress protein [Agrobacterium pusense]CDN95864.1 Universal stress protein [Agrobacterium tumefaciens]
MYQHILIATDGSELAQKGVAHGLSLAKSLGARVTFVTVTEPFPVYAGDGWAFGAEDIDRYDADQQKFAQDIFDALKEPADKTGVTYATRHVPGRRPAEAILEVAAEDGCSLIVMTSHGRRGLGRLLLGSQTSEVVSHSPVPVLVVR